MQRREEQRVTQPLESAELLDVGAVNGAPGMQEDEESVTLAELADPQGADDPAATPAPAATSDPLALPSDDPELVRIREILVGPHLRDHERRLRLVEQRAAEPQALAQTLEQLSERLEREREERQALRLELAHERQAREELASLHAQALSELAQRVDQEREVIVLTQDDSGPTVEAGPERQRELHRQEHLRLEAAHAAQVEALRQLVVDAERALVAMQAERQHLAGLLAELGLHLIRHAASPAAQAEQATEILSVRLSETDPAAGS